MGFMSGEFVERFSLAIWPTSSISRTFQLRCGCALSSIKIKLSLFCCIRDKRLDNVLDVNLACYLFCLPINAVQRLNIMSSEIIVPHWQGATLRGNPSRCFRPGYLQTLWRLSSLGQTSFHSETAHVTIEDTANARVLYKRVVKCRGNKVGTLKLYKVQCISQWPTLICVITEAPYLLNLEWPLKTTQNHFH